MSRLVACVAVLALTGAVACATPWWIAYEADSTFPEEEGWTREHGAIPAERWLAEGALFIDSRASPLIYDYYVRTFDFPIDPDPGELFVLRWRLRVHDVSGYDDPGIGVTSDEAGPEEFYAVGFGFEEDAVHSAFEYGLSAPIEPGVYHEYELRSWDMRNYELYIDEDLALTGVFAEVFGPTRIGWGDTVYGGSSLSEWDYVRSGVVPEPNACVIVLVLLLTISGLRDIRGTEYRRTRHA